MKMFTSLIFILLVSGCTHFLYQGDFQANDNLNESRQYRLWWTKTEPLIGENKAGPMILNVACGVPITLTESEAGISFIAASDKYESTIGETGTTLECAKISNLSRFVDYSKGDIVLTALCKPIADDEGFSAVTPTFLSTEQASYHIPISVKEKWSLLQSAMSAPVLECP